MLVAPIDDKTPLGVQGGAERRLMALAMLEHIAKTGVKTIGYIGVSDGYGEGYCKTLTKAAPKLGIKLTDARGLCAQRARA